MNPARPILTATLAVLALAGSASGQMPGLDYIRKETREATRHATLDQYFPQLEWSSWHVIGPFDNTDRDKFAIVYPPEREVDLEAVHPGKHGVEARWEAIDHPSGWDKINLKRYGSNDLDEDSIAYLYREVRSDREVELTFETGTDDGLKLWFNGRVLIDADVYRGLNVEDHRFTLKVQPGRNTLLAKVSQGVGGWEFQMRPVLDARITAMLEYRLNTDFPGPEDRHYRLVSFFEPEEVVLEVGGLDVLPDGRPIVATRRGDVWIVENAYEEPPLRPEFRRFASGLHEPLGLRWREGSVYVVQRGELTRLTDLDGDDRADVYETVCDEWGVSGNYHEFAFGPKYDARGRTWVTLNLGFCGSLGKSTVPWRGWAVIVNDDGSLTPVCGGLRSPNGLGRNAAGDMFYTDNQGDWVATNKLSHLDFGDWHGHPSGSAWYETAGMDPPAGEDDFKPPAVWFPYGRMGQSASDILLDDTGGQFGPFEGQMFVGDQTNASIMRVFLEKVDGVYQGACFPFREGLDCGVNRMQFAPDGSMFVGMTNRGWGSLGRRPWGLQRVKYTGELPFEVLEMRARPDGFELTFTRPLDRSSALSKTSYALSSFTYRRWEKYGSPEIDRRDHVIERIEPGDDGRSVRIRVTGLHPGRVLELELAGTRSAEGDPLLHDRAWYTLNVVPVVE